MNVFKYENDYDYTSMQFHAADIRSESNYYTSSIKSRNSTRTRRRLILKNGDCNVDFSKISRRSKFALAQDIFTHLMKASWKITLAICASIVIAGWLVFSFIWWVIAYSHGDFEPQHLPPYQKQANFTPCVRELYDYQSCFLFSMESQHTVGYGLRSPTEECPEAIFVNALQCIYGTVIQTFIAGIIFARMTLPKKRTQTLLFSRNAVICLRDGVLCFMFRVGDMRKCHIIDAEIKAILFQTVRTIEGEILRQTQTELELFADDCNMNMHFIWPMIVVHKINNTSPLYEHSAGNLQFNSFEIVVTLEGTIESTGQSTQARSSYLPSETLWGRRFQQILEYDDYLDEYVVDFSKFDYTEPVFVPLCSARVLNEQKKSEEPPDSPNLIMESPSRKISVKHTVCLDNAIELFSYENIVAVEKGNQLRNFLMGRMYSCKSDQCENQDADCDM